MKKILLLILCSTLFALELSAQSSFLLKEQSREQDITTSHAYSDIIVNNDTLLLDYLFVGYTGNVSMGISIYVENISNQPKTIATKKIQYGALQNDVDHTICFGGQCFPENVFVSYAPFIVTLNANTSDSGSLDRFIAHYRFNTDAHINGIDHVAYVFFDVNNPSDSAIVWVDYKAPLLIAGIENETVKNIFSEPFPNPANELVTFKRQNTSANNTLVITNVLGEKIESLQIENGQESITFNTEKLPGGIYSCAFFENGQLLQTKKLVVTH